MATKTAEVSFVPYSRRRDGVVLLLSDGAWIPGVRVECASFSLTIPPLLNAVTTAVAVDRTDVTAAVFSRPIHPAERAAASASPLLRHLRPSASDSLVIPENALPAPEERLSPFLDADLQLEPDAGIALARDIARRAYVPESGFPVGCIVSAGEAGWVPGVNVEHPDWSNILCAERNALSTCVSYGMQDISRIMLTCLHDPDATPCGACRQVLVELAPTTTLWMDRGEGPPDSSDPLTLLPGSFSGERLKSRT